MDIFKLEALNSYLHETYILCHFIRWIQSTHHLRCSSKTHTTKAFFEWCGTFMKSLILNKHLSKKKTENEVSLFTREKQLKILFWFGGGKYCHCCYIIEYWFREDIKTWEKQINIFRDNKWKRYTDLLMSSW